ncbi:4-coumarate--CoA ligase-like 9 [Magnolia sinica]|uniref:4-coumarate--CoA ligase-like 9 n=1 Tax=Magnolia sinica TaxID=86752 RepID=UPI002658B83B|nr:4-coumarate--CoA ligase-like 9 [Magnolia sinica]
MADKDSVNANRPSIDPITGFCAATKTFHSIRPTIPLPPLSLPLSSGSYSLSLLLSSSPLPSSPALIDSTSGQTLSYHDFILRVQSLSSALKPLLSRGQTALILATPSLHIPVLYFSLLSLGVVVSPSNPASTPPEISRQIHISRPVIAFATSASAPKLPPSLPTILLDSPLFLSMIAPRGASVAVNPASDEPNQSDAAAILYSSGTTGKIKGVVLTHRNIISLLAGIYAVRQERAPPAVVLVTMPLFHMVGLFYCLKAVSMRETVVMMERFEVGKMVRAVDEFQVTHLSAAPPVVLAMTKGDMVDPYRLRSLKWVLSGGAPLGKEVIERFKSRFPAVQLGQGYGMTETTGPIFRPTSPEETQHYGSVGRLSAYMEVKIMDPATGIALPPCKQGELWVRGPTITRGYVGDEVATAAAFDSEGWLKTGDLCYMDNDGFLFVVDRLKELIKYKAYQVPPAELEHLLQSHPEITEAAVIPYPDEEAGQVPMAFVVRKPQSTLDDKQVMDFVTKQVAPYKKIRRVSFIDSIPKTAAGKILRKDLVKLATSASAPSKL